MTDRARTSPAPISFAQFLIDESPDALIALSVEGRIRSWNRGAQAMFGYTSEEAIGKAIDELTIPEEGRAEARAAFQRAVHLGSALTETTRRHRNGSLIHVDVSMRRVDTAGGESFVAVSKKDVAFDHRMREASRLKREFLANMSHELRTPLNTIIGFAELMHRGKVGPVSAEHREYLGDILTSSRHLLQLINDVVDLAKIESGKLDFRPESVELKQVAAEVRNVLHGLLASKHLSVTIGVDAEVATAIIDPARVKQVLYNYLSNAIKFTPDGGRIDVRIAPVGRTLFRIDVQDTGVGVSAGDMTRLFGEFQQLDPGTARAHQGAGLGLALTKRLVELQGGRVEVRSTPGAGSTFSAILPRVMTIVPADEVTGPPGAPPAGNRTVLVVDGDKQALDLAAAALRRLGYEPVCATSAEEGLLAAERASPAVAIVDPTISSAEGVHFLTHLRSLPVGQRLPVIVWTVGDVDADERRRLQVAVISKSKDRREGDTLTDDLRRLLPPIPAAG